MKLIVGDTFRFKSGRKVFKIVSTFIEDAYNYYVFRDNNSSYHIYEVMREDFMKDKIVELNGTKIINL